MSAVTRLAALLLWLVCCAAHKVTVRSAGFDSPTGTFLEFIVDDAQLRVPYGRGMNVAVLQSDGTLREFRAFDTHELGSKGLYDFLHGLVPGTLVLIGALDEAQGGLTAQAKEAIADCGGVNIDSIEYRGAYALIGVKGAAALAEKVLSSSAGVAEATAEYVPSGKELRITVRSSGFDSENLAEFLVGDAVVPVSTGRGINVAVVSREGSLSPFGTFDTHEAGSDLLIAFVNDIPAGSLVVMAALDEASSNLSEEAKLAIASCGAAHIEDLEYRGAYALIGIKGGSALAEMALPSAGGVAEVSATHTFPPETFDMAISCSSYDLGPATTFRVNGADLAVAPDRGMNLVVLDATGGVEGFYTFDTHGGGSEALVAAVEALPIGKTVMWSTYDEARGDLTLAAIDAIMSCGATEIASLEYRGAYALIGVKGGAALAEHTEASGVVTVSARRAVQFSMFLPPTTTMTTTTTTLRPKTCRRAMCPAGHTLNLELLDSETSDVSVCCVDAKSANIVDAGVHSAGFTDGNEAIFFAGGQVVFLSGSRGMTVVTLRPDATRFTSDTFDTFADEGSAALQAFLEALAPDTLVLVGAKDEASRGLTPGAKDALRACGATLVDDIRWRSGYALVGVKGGQALSEMVRREGEGYAVAFTQIEVERQSDKGRPVCDARVAEPPVKGYMSAGNLILDAGCRYRLYEKDAAGACLQNTWISIFGSSNTLLEFGNLVNLLAPEEYDIARPGEMVGASAVVDVVIKDGKVVHWATVDNQVPECRQVDKAEATANAAACAALIVEMLEKAPAYESESTRITMFLSFFWDRVNLAVDVLKQDAAWALAQMALVVQVGAWYNVCAVTKEAYCPRKELLAMDRDSAIAVFQADMEEALVQLDDMCGPGGRAGERGCNIQSISWTNAITDNENFQLMNGYIRAAMATRMSPTLRYVDFFALGGGMPEEVVNGHGSQMLNLWMWQVMFGAMCPAELASKGSVAAWHGSLCSGTEAVFENCPNYYPSCLEGPRCERWECMNSVPCTLEASGESAARDIMGMCEAPVTLKPPALLAEAEAMQDPCLNSHGLRNRLWCQDNREWVLPLITVSVAALLLGAPVLRQRAAARRLAAKAEEQKKSMLHVAAAAVPAESADAAPTLLAQPVAEAAGMKYHLPEKVPAEDDGDARAEKRADSPCSGVVVHTLPGDTTPRPPLETVSEGSAAGDDGAADGISEDAVAQPPKPLRAARAHGALARPAAALWSKLPVMPIAGNRFPLGLARFLGSLHVVVGHLYAKGGVVAPDMFFGWGFTWVPWFFMLSGFVLFSAHLKNPKQERMFEYVMRRSNTIYPLYAFSVLVAFAMQKGLGTMQASTTVLIVQSFLLQAWWPGWTDTALQMHCWFLSCMVVYWFFFKPLAWCFKDLTLLRTCLLMSALFALPWLAILVPLMIGETPDWYSGRGVQTDQALQLGITTLKFHPACYAHVFMLGMLLAKLRQHLDRRAVGFGRDPRSWQNPWRWIVQVIAPLGYFGLLLVFNVPGFNPKAWGYKISARLSVLLPFQAMVLLGLAGLPSLPQSAFAFGFSKLDFLERYSYCVYVFQFICYGLWPQAGRINLPLFLIFVASLAVVLAICVQQPIQKWWASHAWSRLAVPFIMASLLGGLSILPDPSPEAASLTEIPALIRHSNGSVDLRLALADPGGPSGSFVINPSLFVNGSEVVVAARRHRYETRRYVGAFNESQVTIEDQVWHSEVLLGRFDVDASAWAAWPATGVQPFAMSLRDWTGLRTVFASEWVDLCVKETYVPANRTLVRHVVTGPEDPKAMAFNGSVLIAFDSNPPSAGDMSCRVNQAGMLDAVTQMYVSSSVDLNDPAKEAVGYHLKYGQTSEAEKNWIPFVHASDLLFVYTPQPHVIVAAQPDGTARKVYSTSYRPLQQLLQEHPGLEARGSGQAVYVDDPEATPNLPQAHYLALLHLFDEETDRYSHFAYRFDAAPPFTVLQLSSQLPLTEAEAVPGGVPFAFVGGLAVYERTVAITYGAGDRDARVLVLTLERLDELFACGNATAPPA